ncbi:MAG: hypothetical protein CM15mP58_15150 [Burkholderiaceae bacterium]|nr:MAG: hypothetical protein CM15mP58_15150 [Burkholderiaceae bacterium]
MSNGIFSIAAIGTHDATGKRGGKRKEVFAWVFGVPHKLSPLHSGPSWALFLVIFSGIYFIGKKRGYATVFLLESAIFGLGVFISLKLKFVKKKKRKINFSRSSSKIHTRDKGLMV